MDPFIGEIRLVPFNFAPRGWAICEGQLLPINQNQALFALLGTTYGGDGRTTFALPDLRGRIPIGAGEPASGSSYALGATGGQDTVGLTTRQLPEHSHAVHASSAAATRRTPTRAFPAGGGAYAADHNVRMKAAMIGPTGGGEVHENRQPYLALNYIIALQGIFPAQS
jgi:microcystin-dependent protein